MADSVQIEVAYALPEKQRIVPITVPAGTSVAEAARLSGIVHEFPQLDLAAARYGVFGKAVRDADSELVQDGDRVEIYRPLLIDPRQARANRVAKSGKE